MLIFGAGEFAAIADCYMDCAKFMVHPDRIDGLMFRGKRVLDVRSVTERDEVFVAVGDNKNRAIIVRDLEILGFVPRSFISPRAILDDGCYGKHCFILELNNIQPFVKIGTNTVLWSGNHIGHHSRIGNHCFVTSHVCIGGGAEIGDYTFIGMNATVFDHVKIGENCIIAAGAVVDRDIPDGHTLSRKGLLIKNEVV